jgi:peptidoglycan/xylan/chitin deacetylase (PgdA/CDA1 family)
VTRPSRTRVDRRTWPRRWSLVGLLVLLLPTLAACGDDSAGNTGEPIAWSSVQPTRPAATVESASQDATPEASPVGGPSQAPAVSLTPDQLLQYQPNELGRIPILMYHAFTTDPASLDDWTVTPEMFRDDLTWLSAHDFYVVSVHDLIHNELNVPPGKHPVVLTFDDASSGQFRLLKDDTGEFYPDPVTAVGVMEAFFAEHPDFGRGGFFAVLPYNCFSKEGDVSTCEERLTWLAEHGYEIGNHTWEHQDLTDVSDETLMRQVAETKLWIDERVSGPANMSGMIVLPYGAFPSHDWQLQLLRDGFEYDGQTVTFSGIMGVEGGPSVSPSSGDWTRWDIARFNTDRAVWGYWKEQIETGGLTLFTSDGNPATVTIPNQVPADVADQLDLDWAQSYGMILIRYDLPEGATPAAIDPGATGDKRAGIVFTARRSIPPRSAMR